MKMPLTFSDSKETQSQEVGLFDNIKAGKESDGHIKNYDSCVTQNDIKLSTEAKYESLDYFKDKSDLPLSIESDLDKKPRHVYISEDLDEDSIVETTALRQNPDTPNSTLDSSVMTGDYLTMSGTIKRGKKKGQSVEVVLNMSREELEMIEANMMSKKSWNCNVKTGVGIHIFLWSFICLPVSIIISAVYSFCLGTVTWYNIFTLFSEKKSLGYKIIVPPFLIILYPFLIITISLGLGIYAGFKQLSFCWDSWLKEFTDYEKGFYGWLCNSLDVPECSPYVVVVLTSMQKP